MPWRPPVLYGDRACPRGGGKSRTGKLSGRSVHSYGAMSQNREKRALPECPGSVRGIGKTGGAHICRTSYTTSQDCRSRQPERNRGYTYRTWRGPISAAERSFLLYREQNDTGAVRRLASWYGLVPDEHGIYYMDGLALKPRYSDVVQLEQPVFEVILDDCGTGLQTVLEGEYDLILFVCGLQPWEKEDSLRASGFWEEKRDSRFY